MNEAFIVSALRSAGARRGGRLALWHPVDLGAAIVETMVERAGLDPGLIEDVIFGCVGQVGEQATNVGRNVALAAGLPEFVPGTTVDRQCGSSQQAIHFAAQAVQSGAMDVVVAGGVESMTRVPMGLAQKLPADNGFGSYMSPRLQLRYPNIRFNQFDGAESIARRYGFSKEDLDVFGFESQRRAAAASVAGSFSVEVRSLPTDPGNPSSPAHAIDEGIRFNATLDATMSVKLIREGGLLTAATSSQICDGAASLLIANERGLKATGLTPLARIHHMSVIGGDPVVMLATPIEATRRALKRASLAIKDIDLYEVNEAFASIPLAWAKALEADPERMNVHGGAIALGHPLGASGARLMTTLLHALRQRGGRYGLQTMCEGGGLANVTIIESL